MKILKWFKKESSPSSQRTSKRRLSEPAPIAIERNDSYLNALAKFNNWRQAHMANCSKKQRKMKTHKSLSNEDIKTSILLYEDINLKSKAVCTNNLNKRKQIRYSGNQSEYISYENSLSHINSIGEEEAIGDEPEYAIPFNDSNQSGPSQFEDCVEENFGFLEYQEFIDDNPLESRNPLMITDLDKSEESTSAINVDKSNIQYPQINTFPLCALLGKEEWSEFIMCDLKQIVIPRGKSGFQLANGAYLGHGEIDHVEISYVKGSCWHSIFNSYEKLRKLRHPHIVLLMGLSIDENAILDALIMEPLENTVFNKIHHEKYQLSVTNCHDCILQITNAVIYLHRLEIVHSNICSLNIFLTVSGIFKLGGFELATKLHENATSISKTDLNVSTTSNLHYQLVSSIEYRNKYAKFNYQAPELLSESCSHIQPTYQADVYGICITLWEILNCVEPYEQFTHQELLKVFTLKNAQLPIYKENRHLPYKNILESGLALQMVNRIQNVIDLKNALNQVHVEDEPLMLGNFKRNDSISFNGSEELELPDKRISTLKKSNIQLKPAKTKFCDTTDFTEPFSLIQYTEISKNNRTSFLSKERGAKSETPHKKYCVNILLKSKTSNVEVGLKHNDELNELHQYNDTYTRSKSLNLSEDNTAIIHRMLRETTDIISESSKNDRSTCIISTEDCYIDDGFSNVLDIGANIELNFNFLQKY